MHSVIGTAIGGVATMVGEPQNLLIAQAVGLDFVNFIINMAKKGDLGNWIIKNMK